MAKRKPAPGGYTVGYGRPPESTQFQPGNQAARGPRQKPKLDQINAMLEEVLTAPVTVKVNGRSVKMPAIRAIFVQARNSALQGDDRGIKQVFDFIERRGLAGPTKTAEDHQRESFTGAREKLKAMLERRVAADKLEERAKAEAASKAASNKKS